VAKHNPAIRKNRLGELPRCFARPYFTEARATGEASGRMGLHVNLAVTAPGTREPPLILPREVVA
jgi:hypothetical protein